MTMFDRALFDRMAVQLREDLQDIRKLREPWRYYDYNPEVPELVPWRCPGCRRVTIESSGDVAFCGGVPGDHHVFMRMDREDWEDVDVDKAVPVIFDWMVDDPERYP